VHCHYGAGSSALDRCGDPGMALSLVSNDGKIMENLILLWMEEILHQLIDGLSHYL
jgi:hypothetical protein